MRQVVRCNEAAAFLNELDELVRHLARVEVVGCGGNALESAGQLGLLEDIILMPAFAVVLKDPPGVGKLRQLGVLCHPDRITPTQSIAVTRQTDRRLDYALQAELAEVLLSVDESFHRARDADRLVTDGAHLGDHVPLRILVHVCGCFTGGGLAKVHEVRFAVFLADEHEPAAAKVTGGRMNYS